jgi:hypothetical protein
MTIIAISGYATCGKDTVADILVADYGYTKYSWADTLRNAAAVLNPIVAYDTRTVGRGAVRYNDAVEEYGYNEAKARFPELRRILQYLGTEVGRNLIDDNVWVTATLKRIASERSLSDKIVIPDTRFPNEANAVRIRSESKNFVVRVTRPGVGPVSDHPSETSLDDFDFDYTLHNDGTLAELADRVEELREFVEIRSMGLTPR